MSLNEILIYMRTAPKEEIEMYNKIVDMIKNDVLNKEDPSDSDDYKILQEALIQKNKIWYDVIHGKYGFFDKIHV
jgi:hypothetical protein